MKVTYAVDPNNQACSFTQTCFTRGGLMEVLKNCENKWKTNAFPFVQNTASSHMNFLFG